MSALVAATCVAAAAFVSRPLLRAVERGRIGSTSGVQFEAAVNWVFCRRYGRITSTDAANRAQINLAEIRDEAAYRESTIGLIERQVGAVGAYCAQTTTAVSAEPGMTLLFAAVLAANARIPLVGIAAELAVIRLVLVWTFVWFLLRAGYSLPFVAAIGGIAVYLVMLLGGNQLYAGYAFILPTVLAGLALTGFVTRARTTTAIVAGFLTIGVWAGFLGNLRTSHYPMALAMIAAALLVARRPLRPAVAGLVAALAGVLLFDQVFVAPLRAQGVNPNHTIAHSLVIGVSYPSSDLARREGIQWDDSVGVAIARRLSPNVVIFGPEYERVLFRYWMDLWRRYPSEMLSIYWNKIWSTGQSLFAFLGDTGPTLFWADKDGRLLRWTVALVWPVARVLSLAGVMSVLLVAGVASWRAWGPEASWPLVAFGLCGLFGFAEAAIILGAITPWYNGVLVFATLFAGLVPCEFAAKAFLEHLSTIKTT